MSIWVSERERRQIEEKAVAAGMTPSAYIRTMALEGGNVDTTVHDDRQKLIHELSAIGNNINQIARMANTKRKRTERTGRRARAKTFGIF